MCGIFGYIGKKNTAGKIVFNGLKLLEYRGYDSWGIAIKSGKKFIVEKNTGKIVASAIKKKFFTNKTQLAIGHTRWATHGGVTIANAHPHTDCTKELSLVHNGIVENFLELKEDLLRKGHSFVSETDTEVIVHLIEEYLKKENIINATMKAFNKLHGLNAIVVAHASSDNIIAVKNGSPLVIGIGKNELLIASDAAGIVPHTKEVIFLEDNQMIILNITIQMFQLPQGIERKPIINTIDWQFTETKKGKFPHFMLKEISEQPETLLTITKNIEEIKNVGKMIKKSTGTFFIGCGTASYACLSGIYLFSKIAKKHMNFSVGSEFNYIEDYLTDKSLLIAVSQSGESIDVVEPVMAAKKKKATIITMTNVLGSTLYRMADAAILLRAGQEKAVLGTKSYTSMLAVMIMLSYSIIDKEEEGIQILVKSAKEVKRIISNAAAIKSLAAMLYKKSHIYILGRGLSYPLALESALKIKESSYIHAEGFAAGELKHGVIALIEQHTPVIVFVPNDETRGAILANAMEVKARGAFLIGVGPKKEEMFDYFFIVKDCGVSSIIPHVVFSQLLGYYLTLMLGHDPDKPRNLAKSVVVR